MRSGDNPRVTDHPRDIRNPYAPSRESLIDRKIREAMDDGAFERLPFQGERLPLEDDSAAGEWALAHRMLKGAGMVPPWVEADKEVRSLVGRIDRSLEAEARAALPGRAARRAALVRLAEDANLAIDRLNAQAPTDRQHRRPLDVEATLRRFDEAARS
jgi:hypothetical protein